MIIGIGGYWLLTNILFESPNHEFTLTNVQLIGYPIVLMITIVGIIFAFKMSSFKSKIKEFSIIYVAALLPILLLVLLMFMNKWYGTPVLQLTTIQSYILAGVILLVLLIGEAYILGWIGILTVIVRYSLCLYLKIREEQPILGNARAVTSVRKFICINEMVFEN